MPVTDQQARAIAYLATHARPHGARHWDEPGLLAAIKRISTWNLAEATIEVITAARLRVNRRCTFRTSRVSWYGAPS